MNRILIVLFVCIVSASSQVLVREYINVTNGQIYARDKIMNFADLQIIPPPGENIKVVQQEKRNYMSADLIVGALAFLVIGAFAGRLIKRKI